MIIFNAKSTEQVSNIESRMTSEFAIGFVPEATNNTAQEAWNLQNMIIGQELVTGQCSMLTVCYSPASSSN
jgi:hypothetical protein